ncbi:MAG: hypothetical protein ABEK01_05580 [Candidatus Nanohaloarchaea archaeon]
MIPGDRALEDLKERELRDQLREVVQEDDDPRNYVAGNGKVVVDESNLDRISREWAERYRDEWYDSWTSREIPDDFDEKDEFFIKDSLEHVPESHMRDPGNTELMLTGEKTRDKEGGVKKYALKGAAVVGLGAAVAPWALASQPLIDAGVKEARQMFYNPSMRVEHPDITPDEPAMIAGENVLAEEPETDYGPQKKDIRNFFGSQAPDYYFRDADGDRLLNGKELLVGTDPFNEDTDEDGLKDSWEVYGVRIGTKKAVPLSEYGADPLQKDIFIQVTGGNIEEYTEENIRSDFENAPVSNPDGTIGIDIHIDERAEGSKSLGGVNINSPGDWAFDRGRGSVDSIISEAGEDSFRKGTFHFAYIGELPDMDITDNQRTVGYGEVNGDAMILREKYLNKAFEPNGAALFNHELGHNVLGILDARNWGDSPTHSKYQKRVCLPTGQACFVNPEKARSCNPRPGGAMYHTMQGVSDYHPNVWSEIERDGLLGLPEPENWHIYYPEN